MTIQEIRSTVPPMAIWMADAAIRAACQGIHERIVNKPTSWNLGEVDVAAKVLFRMFYICVAAAKEALIEVAKDHDGILDYPSFNYFNAFFQALSLKENKEIELRRSDWVLERC